MPGRARRRSGALGLFAVLGVLLLVGCSSDEEPEVAGAVLERGDDGDLTASSDPDDERVDPRVDDVDADADDDAPAVDADAGESAVEDDPGEDRGDSFTPATPSPAQDPAQELTPAPDPTPAPEPAPAPAPAPDPVADPQPLPLAAGVGLPGDTFAFEDDVEIGSSPAVELDPEPGARSDVTRTDGTDDASCRTMLRSPADRGLIATGELSVTMVIGLRDGTSERTLVQTLDLDVRVEPGTTLELVRGPDIGFDRERISTIACEAFFTPA